MKLIQRVKGNSKKSPATKLFRTATFVSDAEDSRIRKEQMHSAMRNISLDLKLGERAVRLLLMTFQQLKQNLHRCLILVGLSSHT